MRRDRDSNSWDIDEVSKIQMFGSDEDAGIKIPTQAQSVVEGSGAVLVSETRPVPDVDYLQVIISVFH